MNTRSDLMHLSPEALAHATNVGVVKRAVRELEGGYSPQCELDDQATLTARFSDGVTTTWAQGKPIQQALCTCGAATVCRHRIITALAFRAAAVESAQQPVAVISPGQVDDQTLAQVIPASLLALAQAQLKQGLTVEVRRQAAGETCDTARLPASTVRFWAGASIEAARCDCIRKAACEHVALAVWAYRQADAEHADQLTVQIRLGDAGGRAVVDAAPYRDVVDALLLHGVTQGATALAQSLSGALQAARTRGATWLDHVLADIENWSMGYVNRSALYDALDGVDLIAELALRLAGGALPGNAKSVLGIGQVGETELDRLRLICIGARTQRDAELRRTRMILADVDTGTRLVLVKEWKVPEQEFAQEASIRASERLAPGVRLEQLAQGQLLAQQARRLADGTLKLAKARSAQNSVLPQAADWGMLGAPLRFSMVDELMLQKRANPTAQVLPRHAAGQFVLFTPSRIEQVIYDPNAQALVAVVADEDGRQVIIRRTYENHLRHALDAVAGAFSGFYGELRHIGGILHWEHGVPIIEPWALACDSVVVPDFATACGALAKIDLCNLPTDAATPIAQALLRLRQTIAAILHAGLKQLPQQWAEDSRATAQQLRALSLHALAQRLDGFAAEVLSAQAGPAATCLAVSLMEMLALAQLHEDAQAVCGFEMAFT